jgi:peroxiredoxin
MTLPTNQSETGLFQNLVGRPAVPFELSDFSGRMHRIEDYRGAWLLMVFHRHLG